MRYAAGRHFVKQRRYTKKWGTSQGFTLIELIIVIILLGLMVALSAPAIGNSLSNLRLNTNARHLAAVLRNTRSKAIADKQNYQITFKAEGKSYTYPTESGNKSVALARGVKIKQVRQADELLEEELTLFFYPKGNSNGGEIILENEREQAFRIEVEPISGRVKIRRGEEEE